MPENAVTGRAGTREWLGLAVLVLPCVLVSMDMSVLFMALPALSADLGPSSSELLWIIDAYGFLLAGLLITMGTLGDRIGRRKLLLAGAAGFGVASVLAAYATGPGMLIAARALLGVAGATLAPSTLSLIRNMFHDAGQRRTAIGIWTAGFSGGGVLGPIVGGLFLEHFWWGSVFLLNVPVMVALLILGPMLLPEFKDPSPGRFDVPGAVLSVAAVTTTVFGVKRIAEDGFVVEHLAVSLAGLALGAAFLIRQARAAHPMIDLTLFRRRGFSVPLATNGLVMFALMGFGMFTAQFMQLVLGYSPFEAALWSLCTFFVMPLGVALATMFAPRAGRTAVIVAGLLVGACGYVFLTRIDADSGVAHLLVANGITILGMGAVFALVTDLVLAAAPPERAGAASATSETASEFGGALGIAVLGSVGVAVYRSDLADNAPAGLTDSQLHAAQDTLGGALDTASRLGPADAAALVDAATQAFAHEMRIVAAFGAALFAAAATVVAVFLRGRHMPAPAAAPGPVAGGGPGGALDAEAAAAPVTPGAVAAGEAGAAAVIPGPAAVIPGPAVPGPVVPENPKSELP